MIMDLPYIQRKLLKKVTGYLKARIDINVEQVLLVAHNGHSFDQNRFVTLIDKSGGLSNFEDKIYFGDSYQDNLTTRRLRI